MNQTAQIPGRAGWYYGWYIIAVCILVPIGSGGLAVYTFSLFLQDWSAQLHAPISLMVLGLSSCSIGTALLSPILGYLVSKFPIRLFFMIGTAAAIIFAFGISFMEKTWQYLVLYALILPVALSFPSSVPSTTLLSRWFVRRRGLAFSLIISGPGMAGVILPPIVASLLPHFGWRIVWRGAGILFAVILVPLVAFVLRERPAERDGRYYLTDDGEAAMQNLAAYASAVPSLPEIFGRRNFWLLIIIFLSLMAFWGGAGQNLVPIALSRGLSAQTGSILLSLYNLAYLAGTLGCGIMADRLGNRLPLLGLSVIAIFGALLLTFAHGVFAVTAGFIGAGLAGAFFPSVTGMMVEEYGPQGFGKAFGILIFFLPLAAPASFAVARAEEYTGNYLLPLLALSGLTVLAAISCFFLIDRRKHLPPAGARITGLTQEPSAAHRPG